MERLMKFVVARASVVAVVSLLLTAVAAFVVATRWNIDSDFKALLPQESPAARAMTDVGDRIGSGSALFVVIDSPRAEANLEFAEVYAERLREIDEVALAHYHNDKTFFERHALLYLETEDLRKIRERLAEAIKDAKKRANPLFVALDDPEPAEVDTSDIEKKYEGSLAHDKYKEYLVSDDGYSVTVIVRFVETSTNLIATNELLDRVQEIGDSLDPTSYHPEMKIELGGGLVNRKKEYDSLLDDVQLSAVFTILALFGVIGLYFRRARAIVLVLGPLIMSVIWTLAAALIVYEALTTITAFIFAILLGLGIDFSIHLLSSYDHERASGLEIEEALMRTYRGTGTATLIGAATTFSVFVVLAFAQFRGLSQFGVVAAVGVVMAALAMVVSLPAFIVVLDRFAPSNPRKRVLPLDVEDWGRKTAWSMLAFGLVITLLAVWSGQEIFFEENFRKVAEIEWPWETEEVVDPVEHADHQGWRMGVWRYKKAREVRADLEPETFVMDREQDSVGRKYSSAVGTLQTSTPTIVLFDDADDARRTFHVLHDAMKSERVETVKGVASIWAFVPAAEDQRARLEEIRKIEELLEGEDLGTLSEEQKARIEELRPRLDVEPFDVTDLPEWTKRLFKEAGPAAMPAAPGEPYAYQYTVYLNEAVDSMVGQEARRFLRDVERIGEEIGLELRVASPSVVYVAMLDQIKTDGVRMIAYAIVVVFLLLALMFRGPVRASFALVPLGVGVVWMVGLAAFLGIKLDFFNVIVLPVVLGIGIDDGVHFYHHYLESGSVGETVRRVGASVSMTSITSMIGFGGLAITDYPGLASIGHLAICGIATTWLATIVVMPALLLLRERRGGPS